MSETAKKVTTARGKEGKGSKAAYEAAGWKFAPLAALGRSTGVRVRYENCRGTMAIPPAGSGIEPRQFGGSGRAVEQLGQTARQPDDASAGMAGIQILLTAALASGEICGGRDDSPERPDAELLTICKDALGATAYIETPTVYRGSVPYGKSPEHAAWSAAFKTREVWISRPFDPSSASKINPAYRCLTV